MITLVSFLAVFSEALGGAIPYRNEPHKEGYIVGGKDTKIEEVPYQVSLHMANSFMCGGSIISPTHILTAAHCVRGDSNPDLYEIRAGSSYEMYGGVLMTVKKVTYHPKFNIKTVDYDVGIVELNAPLTFNASIKAIKIADKAPADGESVKASGWGCTKENGPRPKQLQSVVIPMVNRKTCENNYKKYMEITPRMICAGLEGKDACQGDSGGPLVYKDTIVGIVSSGVGCARKDLPGIYANVADPEVRKFIKEHTNV